MSYHQQIKMLFEISNHIEIVLEKSREKLMLLGTTVDFIYLK